MSVYVSSGAFADVRDLAELLPRCRDLGIDHVELASGLRAGDGFAERIAEEKNINFLLHNYFPAPEKPFVLNLADADVVNRERSIQFCRFALAACSTAGVPFYSVHAGFVASLRPEDLGNPDRQRMEVTEADAARAIDNFVESVEMLTHEASRLGVRLLLENNVHAVPGRMRSHLLMVTPDDIGSFFRRFSHPSLGLLLDVAHLKVSATHRGFNPVDGIESVSPWVGALHLSDNDGLRDTNDLCRPDSWFWDPLNAHCSDPVEVVLESYRLTPNQISQQQDLISTSLLCAS